MEVRSKFSRPVDTLVHINSSETQKLKNNGLKVRQSVWIRCVCSVYQLIPKCFFSPSVNNFCVPQLFLGVRNPKPTTSVTFITCADFFFSL